MPTYARIVIAAAAVVVVAVVGINLLPGKGGVGVGPSGSPAPSLTSAPDPLPTPRAVTPSPDPPNVRVRHSLDVDGVRFSVGTRLWSLRGVTPDTEPGFMQGLYVSQSIVGGQDAEAVIYWTGFPDGVHADPCATLLNLRARASAADLAAAVSTAPGTELVTGPTDVTVGGRPAKHVVLTVRVDLGCDPGYFFTWQDSQGGQFWRGTDVGDTIRVWIVDVDGTRLFIGGETHRNGAILEEQLQQIIDSIRFE